MTLRELKRLDAGSWFSGEYAGERIPSLREVLERSDKKDRVLNIEIKNHGHDPVMLAERVLETLEEDGTAGAVIISSFDFNVLSALRKISGSLRLGLSCSGQTPEEAYRLAGMIGAEFIELDHSLVNEGTAGRIHSRGYKLTVWSVNDPERFEWLRSEGVDHIITDNPELLKR